MAAVMQLRKDLAEGKNTELEITVCAFNAVILLQMLFPLMHTDTKLCKTAILWSYGFHDCSFKQSHIQQRWSF